MIQYNISIKVEHSIADAYLAWLQNEHLQDVLNTKCFDTAQLSELLEPTDEEGKTFVVSYTTTSKARYNTYIELYAPIMREKGFQLFGNKFIAFRTLMHTLHTIN
jgi:Domain of unknown function (DUF4286)